MVLGLRGSADVVGPIGDERAASFEQVVWHVSLSDDAFDALGKRHLGRLEAHSGSPEYLTPIVHEYWGGEGITSAEKPF